MLPTSNAKNWPTKSEESKRRMPASDASRNEPQWHKMQTLITSQQPTIKRRSLKHQPSFSQRRRRRNNQKRGRLRESGASTISNNYSITISWSLKVTAKMKNPHLKYSKNNWSMKANPQKKPIKRMQLTNKLRLTRIVSQMIHACNSSTPG